MTSRGSRFNPYSGGAPGKDSPEWIHTTTKNMRNFIRKWGTVVQHDHHMKPIVSPKYDIGFQVRNTNINFLRELEPWCSCIYLDADSDSYIDEYIKLEQSNTEYDLSTRIKQYGADDVTKKHDVVVQFDAAEFDSQAYRVITNISEILKGSGEIGQMEYYIFRFFINSLKTYEGDLIVCK